MIDDGSAAWPSPDGEEASHGADDLAGDAERAGPRVTAPHYFDDSPETPSAPITVAVDVPGARFDMETDRGVFSHGQLDTGTRVLLRSVPPPPPTGRLLDLGCGAGAIALTMATRSPDAQVVAVDVNERARDLCERNARRLGLHNVTVLHPDDVDADASFELVWSNPPIRIGKEALHELLTTWLGRLTDDGAAFLVVQRNLGADSLARWLTEHGYPMSKLSSSKGYRVLVHRR